MNEASTSKAPPLERYVRILEVLAAFHEGVTAGELGVILDLPRPTVHRLLNVMIETRIVEQVNSSRYCLGTRMSHLALVGADELWLEPLMRPILREVVEATGLTAYIGRLAGLHVVSLILESPDEPWRGYVLPGREFVPHASAGAKAIFAYQSAELVEHALMAAPLERFTEHTIVDRTEILANYAEVRRSGYATCIGEIDEELLALAVPISIEGLPALMSLGVTSSQLRLPRERLPETAALLQTFARRFGALLERGRA